MDRAAIFFLFFIVNDYVEVGAVRWYLEQIAHDVRLLGVGRAVAVRVARHEVGTRLHQLAVEHDPIVVLDALGRYLAAQHPRTGAHSSTSAAASAGSGAARGSTQSAP